MSREVALDLLVSRVMAIETMGTVNVAIDGPMGSGKTTFAREIAEKLSMSGYCVLLASADDFFNSIETRYARGLESAIGCYEDTYDLEKLKHYVLNPVNPEGNGKIDFLIFEGLFLLRPELNHLWHYRVFLEIEANISVNRASKRDLQHYKSMEELLYKHRYRYIPAQKLYKRKVRPDKISNSVVNNNDLENPTVRFNIGVNKKQI